MTLSSLEHRRLSVREFGKKYGYSNARAYPVVHSLPPGVKYEVAGRLWVNEDKYLAWVNAGGSLASESGAVAG